MSVGTNRGATHDHVSGAAHWGNCGERRDSRVPRTDSTHQRSDIMVIQNSPNSLRSCLRIVAADVRRRTAGLSLAKTPPPHVGGYRASGNSRHAFRQRGALMVELIVAMAILTGALLPIHTPSLRKSTSLTRPINARWPWK